MAFSSPLGNLKGFASSRPPLLVFTICLAAFALTTLSLAYFVRTSESIPNPDITLDWTSFLKHLSALDLCITPDESPLQQKIPNNSRLSEETDDGSYGNVSIVVTASLSLLNHFLMLPQNITTVTGVLPLTDWSSLCLSEPGVAESTLNVTITLPQNLSNPHDVCVTFSGLRSLLPIISQSPPSCTPTQPRGQGSGTARLETRSSAPDALGERVDDSWCQAGAEMRLNYHLGPVIGVILSMRERSLINLHLVHTSYFLFVMAMTLVCYALIKGKHKQKIIAMDKMPLDI